MSRLIVSLCFLIAFFSFGAAQTADEYKKAEFFVGYSYGRGAGDALHGVNGSGVYNFSRYFGIKADVSATFSGRRVGFNGGPTPPITVNFRLNRSVYNILGGIQVKDNADKGRFKPFAHLLVGVGHDRSRTSDFQCSPIASCPPFVGGTGSNTGFAAAVGGGLDLRLNKRVQFRLIQLDYNPMTNGFGTSNRLRLGTGIVF